MSNGTVLYNFRKELPNEIPLRTDLYELRSNTYIRDPEFSIESYIAYLGYLKLQAQTAPADKVYMLRLGFIPLVMAPHFWQDNMHNLILKIIPSWLTTYPRRAVSFVQHRYDNDFPDIWVSKLDVAEWCGCKPEAVTVAGVLKRCGL